MTQYVEIDAFDNVTGFPTADEMPVRDGFTYEVQDPPVQFYPAAPYRKAGLKRVSGENVWIDYRTFDERCEDIREERDKRYALSDRVIMQCFRLNQSMPAPWAAYAQALADVPSQEGFPDTVVWPTPPT